MSLLAALPLATLPCILLAHWLLSSAVGGLRQRGVCLLAGLVCAGAGLAARGAGGNVGECTYAILVSAGIAYSYFHLFNMSLTARRIHILVRRLSGEETAERYDAAQIIDRRLARLEQMGILRRHEGRIYVRSRIFLASAWLLERARGLFYVDSPAAGPILRNVAESSGNTAPPPSSPK